MTRTLESNQKVIIKLFTHFTNYFSKKKIEPQNNKPKQMRLKYNFPLHAELTIKRVFNIG